MHNSPSTSLPPKGKLIALDLGQARTGLAISDSTQEIAFPRQVLSGDWFPKLKELIDSEDIQGIIVGIPKNLRGEEGEQAQKTRLQIEELKSLKLPILEIDERFTSQLAAQRISGKELDSESARILLETYLDSIKT